MTSNNKANPPYTNIQYKVNDDIGSLNNYSTSEWGVRLIKIDNPNNQEEHTIRIVWNLWYESKPPIDKFIIKCVKINTDTQDINFIKPQKIKILNFDTTKCYIETKDNNYSKWATGNYLNNYGGWLKFNTYISDIKNIKQDKNDYMYVYTIYNTYNNSKFTSYFIIQSINTKSCVTMIGDNGVCFKDSQGHYCGNGDNETYKFLEPGFALANKFFYYYKYSKDSKNSKYDLSKYNLCKYDIDIKSLIYKSKSGTNYLFRNNGCINNLLIHVGDIAYGGSFGNFCRDYFKGMECIHSIIPSLYTLGNHEYWDGDDNLCGTYLYMYLLFPMNYDLMLKNNILEKCLLDNNWFISKINNDLITQGFCNQTSTLKYKTYEPIIFNGFVYSQKSNEILPKNFYDNFLNNKVLSYDNFYSKNINQCFYWHISDNNYISLNNIKNYMSFWGHEHNTKILFNDNKIIKFCVGGFGAFFGGPYGWVELHQSDVHNCDYIIYNWNDDNFIGSKTQNFHEDWYKNLDTFLTKTNGLHNFNNI